MAGTNTSKNLIPDDMPPAPAVILVRPQLGENIGMCARAMLNCAVTELRIVKPRDGWPNPDAIAAASGAIDLLNNAKIFETTAEAVADLEYVLATTARNRDLAKKVLSTKEAAHTIRQRNHAGKQRCGILFGPERTGLENDDIALADVILNIPLNPSFSSLNLAQAVLLVCHDWLEADNPFHVEHSTEQAAHKDDINNLMRHLEEDLTQRNFFRSPEQKPTILRNIRNYFFRSGMTEQEVRTMHGIFSCLKGKKSQEG